MSCSSAPVTATSRSMPGNVALIALTAWATVERVLEQAVQVGLVVVLGRRRDAVQRPGLGAARRRTRRAGGAGAGPARCRRARAGRPPSGRPRAAGRRAGRPRRSVPVVRRAQRADRDLRAPALVDLVAADDVHGRAARGTARRPARRRPRPWRRRRPCGRRASSLRYSLPSRPAPPRGLADQEDLVDVGAVVEVADEHGGQGDRAADGPEWTFVRSCHAVARSATIVEQSRNGSPPGPPRRGLLRHHRHRPGARPRRLAGHRRARRASPSARSLLLLAQRLAARGDVRRRWAARRPSLAGRAGRGRLPAVLLRRRQGHRRGGRHRRRARLGARAGGRAAAGCWTAARPAAPGRRRPRWPAPASPCSRWPAAARRSRPPASRSPSAPARPTPPSRWPPSACSTPATASSR